MQKVLKKLTLINFIIYVWCLLCLGFVTYAGFLALSVETMNCRITGVIVNFDSREYICKNKQEGVEVLVGDIDTTQQLYYGKLLQVVMQDGKVKDIR